MLLYSMGEEAEMVLSSTNISESERKSYDNVLGSIFKSAVYLSARASTDVIRWKVSPGTSILLNCTIWRNGAHMDH